ncbi:MAG TPA: TadE/TadG family type IV pilus assembly protein [Bryobacteraceae bacterium]|jgi:Flp pilus assembly protein TadG
MPRKHSERGQSFVETGLVLIIFLMMLIGIIDFGQVLYFHQSLVERARAAARYGAIHPTDTTGIQNMAVYNTASYSGSAPPAILSGLTTSMVDVQNPDINTSAARVVVTISNYPMNFISPYIAQSFHNRAIMVAMGSETQIP